MTLRGRLTAAFVYVLLLAGVTLSVPLFFHVSDRAQNDVSTRLLRDGEAIAAAAADVWDEGPDALNGVISAPESGARILVVDETGALLADSAGFREIGTDYRYRVEIRRALRGLPTRLVRTYQVAGETYNFAVPIVHRREVVGAVRVGLPVATVNALVQQRLVALLGVLLGLLLVGVVVAALLARSLTRPLRNLALVARRIGDGDMQARAELTGPPEAIAVATALNAMTQQIAETLNAQSDFLANASHQLRTPLTGLRLRLEALERGADGDQVAAAIRETDRLSSLVDGLLALLRAGANPPVAGTISANDAAQDAFDRWSVQAADEDHTLLLEPHGTDPLMLASTDDVAMVLDNLVSNALKYTPPLTHIRIGVATEPGRVVLTVSDNGPGIAPADRSRIFDRFIRGSSSNAASGTGLGLAIVKEIAHRWGGSVFLGPGPGTSISVRFPAAATSDTDRLPVLQTEG